MDVRLIKINTFVTFYQVHIIDENLQTINIAQRDAKYFACNFMQILLKFHSDSGAIKSNLT